MRRHFIHAAILLLCCCMNGFAQEPVSEEKDQSTETDSIKKIRLAKSLGNGYLPLGKFDLDLRFLLKYNQYEGLRTGLGGVTNNEFSEKYKIQSYVVYGFRDHRFKYSIGGGFRISEPTNTWLHLSYTDDLEETGSSKFLTDKRFFQFFEPRLLNIDLFHKHITKALTLEHRISPRILTEMQLSTSKIEPTYNYALDIGNETFNRFDLSLARFSMQWNPFDQIMDGETNAGYPQMAFQVTQSIKDVLDGSFAFTKLDFRTVLRLMHANESKTEFTLKTGMAFGDVPITHLYHAYPNNVNKETIMQRFSVAGINSFETMYFNEFFSDRFAVLQVKHRFKAFNISQRFKPELVLISRYAIGTMDNISRHQGIQFSTLDKGYTESGIELNKLLFGFGLSLAYRYGGYHLPRFDDNIAFKFTFNIDL